MILVFQRILLEALFHVLFFPFWWYTKGLVLAIQKCWSFVRLGNEFLIPGLWWRNLFVPMFGQVDWQGRLVSFGIRIVNAIIRTFVLLVWTLLAVIGLAIWIVLPVVATYVFVTAIWPEP